MTNCPRCGIAAQPMDVYCGYCGTRIAPVRPVQAVSWGRRLINCRSCQFPNDASAVYCGKCGNRLALTRENTGLIQENLTSPPVAHSPSSSGSAPRSSLAQVVVQPVSILKVGDEYEVKIARQQLSRGLGWIQDYPVFVQNAKTGDIVLVRITKSYPGASPKGLDKAGPVTTTDLLNRGIHFAEGDVERVIETSPILAPAMPPRPVAPTNTPPVSNPQASALSAQTSATSVVIPNKPEPRPQVSPSVSSPVPRQTLPAYTRPSPDTHLIAIIGPSLSGKTVFASLIYHELVMNRANLGVKNIRVSDGNVYLSQTLGKLRDGVFPDRTVPGARPSPIVINVDFDSGWLRNKKIRLYLGDFSGEYIDGKPPEGTNLVETPNPRQFLRTAAGGRMAYIADADAYLLIVDPTTQSLSRLAFYYNELLNRLALIKTGRQESYLKTPLGVLVTKWDLLPEGETHQTPDDYVARHLEYFVSQARAVSKYDVRYFRVQVATRLDAAGKSIPVVDSGNLKVWGATEFVQWLKEVL